MQSVNNQPPARDVRHEDKNHRPDIILIRSDVAGFVRLGIVAFGILMFVVARFWVNEHSYSIKFFTEAMFSFLALIVVAGQLLIYDQQRQIMQRQLAHVGIGERAYMGIVDMQLVQPKPLAANVPVHIHASFQNGGKTPAWKFRSHYRAIISYQPISEVIKQYPVDLEKGTGAFVIAGQTKTVKCPFDFTLSDKQVHDITVSKTHKLFILTVVTFRDYLDESREISFRAVLNPDTCTFDEADYDDETESK